MDPKTVKLNCLTHPELENEHIFKKKCSVPLINRTLLSVSVDAYIVIVIFIVII